MAKVVQAPRGDPIRTGVFDGPQEVVQPRRHRRSGRPRIRWDTEVLAALWSRTQQHYPEYKHY
eukprot:8363774-Prorocentrum_lima.AAC.1